ncbi:hypothetical protein CAP35_14635 [Chitinophagaceae bacterium IBVUCB1]|nr:hypothetical protein CAP35_14635 [Chitinophagaceae bacterium IBVUCB1]
MKKLFLLMCAGVVAIGANAQQKEVGVPFVKGNKVVKKMEVNRDLNIIPAPAPTAANKTTAGNNRWYNHYDAMNQLVLGNALDNNDFVFPIWFDSTVRQRFSTGLGTINFTSVAQTIDPIGSQPLNDPGGFTGDIRINSWNSYTVDSVEIRGAYIKMSSRPTSIVDTLIFSVVPMDNVTYYMAKSNPNYGSKVSQYTTADTMWASAPIYADSVGRSAFAPTGGTRAFWKVPLFDADRDTATGTTVTVRTRRYKVPGSGLVMPAGTRRFALTCTFKSGDTWTKNVDSVTKFHRFQPLAGASTANGAMPYVYTSLTDRSGSSIMFSTDTNSYTPTILIEIYNTNDFDQEFINMGAFVKCTDCWAVNVANASTLKADVKAVPNPAQNEVAISFGTNVIAETKISILNTMGQVVATQNMGNVASGIAKFSTANLTNGIYFYSLEANGQRVTNRFVVAH